MQLNRILVSWSGAGVIGLAANVLHYAGDVGPVDAQKVSTAYAMLRPILNSSTGLSIPNSGDVIEDTTGSLTGEWTSTGGGQTTGTAAFNPAAGVGACVTWNTGGIVTGASGKGRRLRGRTFIVPLATVAYDSDGSLTSSALQTLNDFGNGMLASGPLAVWHRPTTKGGSNGNSYGVTSFKVRDKVAFLSSRRD
jgi:hypothetical protein